MPKGVLVAALDFAGAAEDEFNDWYDREHVPQRMAVPGFLSAQRWIGVDNPRHSVVIHDLDTLGVLDDARYRAVSGDNASPWTKRMAGMCTQLMRAEAEQLVPGERLAPEGAGGLLLIALNIAPEAEADFNAWYDEEHMPALAAVPGTICARRFRSRRGAPRYFALYHLAAPGVPDSAAWKKAVDTPWSARLRPRFRDRVRLVCRPYRRLG